MRKTGKLTFVATFLIFTCAVCMTAEMGSLVKINYKEQNGRVLLEFRGAQRLSYRVKEYESPPHLLVQFFNTKSALPFNQVQVGLGNVTHLSVKELVVNGETATFVSVHLNYASEFDFNLSTDGTAFQLNVKSTGQTGSAASPAAGRTQADTGNSLEQFTFQDQGSSEDSPPVIQIPGEKTGTKQIPYSALQEAASRPGDEVEIPYKVKEGDTSPYIVGPVILQDADISQTVRLLSEAAGGANIVVEASLVGQGQKGGAGGGITVTLSHITLEDALDIITSANNWTWRKYGDYYSIMSKDTAMQGLGKVKAGSIFEDTATKMKVVFIKPQASYACDLLPYLNTVIADVGCDSNRNLILLRGIDKDIDRAREIIKTIDVPIKDVTKRASQVTKIIRLKFIKMDDDFAIELKRITQNAYFSGLRINPDANMTGVVNSVTLDIPTNSLIFVGDDYIYERFFNLVQQLDIPSRQKIVRVIPLRFATVSDIRTLESVGEIIASQNVILTFSESTNTITYTGPEDDFDRFKKIVESLDIEDRRYVTEVIDLKFVNAGDIRESEMMKNLSKFPGFGLRSDCANCGTALEYDLQTNSIIISSQQQYMENLRNLIKSMDQNVFDDYEFETFRLKYAGAYRAAQIVGALMKTEKKDDTLPGDGGFFSLPDQWSGGQIQDFEQLYQQSYKWMSIPNMADNSLYVLAKTQEMEMIRAIIKSLDSPMDQLKLDVQVIELTRNDETRYRLGYLTKDGKFSVGGNIQDNYFFGNNDQDGTTDFFQNTFQTTDSELNDFEGGFIIYNTLTDYVAGFSLNLDVLIQKVNGRLVANPSIMTPESKTVTFDFSESIPYAITSFGQIEVRNANNGIVMNVTPHFKDNYVLLDLDMKVSTVTGYTRQNFPIESARKIDTEIKCEDGIPFIIGGIIKSQETLTRISFPVLSDLPLVGSLFRKKQKKVEEYEVIMVITPTIVKTDF